MTVLQRCVHGQQIVPVVILVCVALGQMIQLQAVSVQTTLVGIIVKTVCI